MQAEVIIVGGGIIGCAAAYHLAKEGVSVLVLEGSPHISKPVAEAVRYAGYKRRILSARKFAAWQYASPRKDFAGLDRPSSSLRAGCSDDFRR